MSGRFLVLGGPRGHLSCRPAGCPMITDRYRRWTVLLTVNRPLTPSLAEAAKDAALRRYEQTLAEASP
jgi:hypothetical protein